MTHPLLKLVQPSKAFFDADLLKKTFQQNGYVVVDFGFPQDLIEETAEFIRRHPWKRFLRWGNSAIYNGIRVQDAWRTHSCAREIAVFEPVRAFLKVLYEKRPLPFQTLHFPVGTEQAIHSDVVHFNCWPNDGSLCGVWVALEDIDEDNGPLVYYPGSHLLPEIYPVNFNLPPGTEHYSAYEAKLKDLVRHLDIKPEKTTLKKGQALIWAANLLHGGDSVKDKSRTRFTQVTHYFFEGSEFYWTPLLSDFSNGKIVRRNPAFIPEGDPTFIKKGENHENADIQ